MRTYVIAKAERISVELRHGNAPSLPPLQVVVDYDNRVVELYDKDMKISEIIFFENIVKVKPIYKAGIRLEKRKVRKIPPEPKDEE